MSPVAGMAESAPSANALEVPVSPIPSTDRATTRRKKVLTAGAVTVALLPVAFAGAQASDPMAEPLVSSIEPGPAACPAEAEPPAVCGVEYGEPLCLDPAAAALFPPAGSRSLMRAAQWRITSEGDASRQSFSLNAEHLTWSAERPQGRPDSARSWPFALGLTADALSTYWALQRGAVERNPLLSSNSFDVAMAKIVQFPLLTIAVDSVEKRNPKLGRRLRWATLAFHAALAFNNVRLGLSAPGAGTLASRSGPAGLR